MGVREGDGGGEGIGQSGRVLREAAGRLGDGVRESGDLRDVGRGGRVDPPGPVEADQALHQAEQRGGGRREKVRVSSSMTVSEVSPPWCHQ
ncbi:hypothetical protein GCM10020254_78110 [Streptomyces goshikiensis]